MVCALPLVTQKYIVEETKITVVKFLKESGLGKPETYVDDDLGGDAGWLEDLWHERKVKNFDADPTDGKINYAKALQKSTRSDVRKSVERLLKARTKRKAKKGK